MGNLVPHLTPRKKDSGKIRVWIANAVRIVGSIGLIVLVLSRVPLASVAETLGRIDLALVIAAIALYFAVNCLASYKWQLLLAAQDIRLSFARTLKIYLVGLFFSLFLPTGFGGDALRGYYIARATGRPSDAVVAIGVDRVHSLWALLLIAVPCYLVSYEAFGLPWEVGIALAAITVVTTAVMAALLIAPTRHLVGSAIGRLPSFLGRRLGSLLHPFEVISQHTLLLGKASLAALGFQALGFVVQQLLFASLGVSVGVMLVVIVVSLSTLIAILPVSINGIGLREGTYVLLLAGAAVGPSTAVSLSLLSLAVLMVSSLVGGVLLLVGERPTA